MQRKTFQFLNFTVFDYFLLRSFNFIILPSICNHLYSTTQNIIQFRLANTPCDSGEGISSKLRKAMRTCMDPITTKGMWKPPILEEKLLI